MKCVTAIRSTGIDRDSETSPAIAGEIYLDVPFDENDVRYRGLQAFLEFPDGSMRFPDVKFVAVPLEVAQANVHHDEPGFWEAWADRF
jgi:hypothetical protein